MTGGRPPRSGPKLCFDTRDIPGVRDRAAGEFQAGDGDEEGMVFKSEEVVA
jgi:hypothetical protein